MRVDNFFKALKKADIEKDDIVAPSLKTRPNYEYNRQTKKQDFIGYTATRNITVHIRKLQQLSDIMDLALRNDIQTVGNVRYESSKADEHRNKARLKAINNSKAKAKSLAQAYDAELGSIVSIQYHNRQANFAAFGAAPIFDHSAMLRESSQPRQATYLPDEITFSDNIQVTFDLIVNN